MKIPLIFSALTMVGSCATTRHSVAIENLQNSIKLVDTVNAKRYSNTITAKELSDHLYSFSSLEHDGRETGTEGQKLAATYLQSYYQEHDIKSPFKSSNYFQSIPKSFLPEEYEASENVLAFIEGSTYPEEIIIISAHLDHLGEHNGEVFYGADDNGSGTVALLEIAEAFKEAKDNGHGPKRSILFLHLTAEEIGLQGSKYYIKHPVFKLKHTIANLNIDMIGRIDKKHEAQPNYIYLIGSDRLSKELHYLSEKVNQWHTNLELDYTYNDENDKNRYYYRSDHYNFAKEGIPVIFYFNGEHDDYHKSTDTPDKIEFSLLTKRTQLVFATAWQIANQEHCLKVD